nr:hypothetical protein [Cytophagales bacterium]
MFQNRKLIIATKHQKERVIAPILERELGVRCFTDKSFDTDLLGTFTGEIERKLDPVSTAREKCLWAMRLTNCDLGVASEGSFGPHPSLFFVPADEELLIFIDLKNNLEIIVRELSVDTNFDVKVVTTADELTEFAESAGFPSHALILRPSKNDYSVVVKGISSRERLLTTFQQLCDSFDAAYVETDMRALYNPTRMKVIETAASSLVSKLKSTCPACQMPGFAITSATRGLECSLCGAPTHSTRSYIYACSHCGFEKEALYPHNKTTEDPMYCDYCNP